MPSTTDAKLFAVAKALAEGETVKEAMLAAGYGYSTVKQERIRWTDAGGLPLSPATSHPHQPLTPPTSHPTNLNPHQLTHQLSPLSPRHTPTPLPTPLFCNPPFQQSRPPTALSDHLQRFRTKALEVPAC